MQKDAHHRHVTIDKPDPRTQQQHFIDYASFYPLSTSSSVSPTGSCIEDAADVETEQRLSQARLALEYQQLYNRYAMCLSHLHDSLQQIDFLRESYDDARMANADLVKRLGLLSQATIHNCLADDFNRQLTMEEGSGSSPTSVIDERNRFGPQRSGKERVTLPKSISVRSNGYMAPQRGGGNGVPSRGQRNSVKSPAGLSGSQRVCVPATGGGEKESSALEFDVYNQGMFKTELCNKWQETGACPYGDNCQFAHGITELRPVIRHPRYKTEVCRMVLAGDNCPYGHRCHFRHSLSPQEKLLGPLRLNELNG